MQLSNKFEFTFRAEASEAQRGLNLITKAIDGMKYGGDPFTFLESEKLLAELRDKALNEGYFEELIRRHLLANPATVTVVLRPDPKKQAEEERREHQRLAEIDRNATPEERKERIRRTVELSALQQEPNSPQTLALLPSLALSDLPKKVNYHEVTPTEMFGCEVLVSELPTNHITHLDIGFNAAALSPEQLVYLDLFATIATEIGTEHLNFIEFAKKRATVTGSFEHSASCLTRIGRRDCRPILWFHLTALPRYLEAAVALAAEIFSSLSFRDRAHIREIVSREFAWAEHSVQSEGWNLATTRILSHLSAAGRCNELINGASAWLTLKELAKNYDAREEQFIATLKETARLLFNRSNMVISVTAEEEELSTFSGCGATLVDSLGDLAAPPPPVLPGLNLPTHEAFITAAEVVFAGLGATLFDKGVGCSGSFEVVKTWLNRDYLWNTVRQMGGAYGCFSQYSMVS